MMPDCKLDVTGAPVIASSALFPTRLRVLVACEYSGSVRDASTALGHDAMSCDLPPSDKPGKHHQGDVLEILDDGWDMMIAHPPCTYLTNAGVRHLMSIPTRNGTLTRCHGVNRWKEMHAAAEFFVALRDAPIPRVAVENPIPHRYARNIIGPYSQLIQPWQFGHGETKATCLWLRGLPKLKPTNIVDGRYGRCHHTSPSPDRWKIRSLTYSGIARAMAEQWSVGNAKLSA